MGRTKTAALVLFFLSVAAAPVADAVGASFSIRCQRQTGATPPAEKYGEFYFFLREGEVKGFDCSVPGRPCEIVGRDRNTVVFRTPGEEPATLSLDLRTGSIVKTTVNGDQSKFLCRQIPNPPL